MAKLKVEVEVSKETYELGQGIAEFIKAVKEALSDGWQLGQDLPAVLDAAMNKLVPSIDGITETDDEYREDRAAFMKAIMLGVSDIYGALQPGDAGGDTTA